MNLEPKFDGFQGNSDGLAAELNPAWISASTVACLWLKQPLSKD